MSYLEACQNKVTRLNTLIADYKAIASNSNVAWDHRFHLVSADACLGKIKSMFAELNIDYPVDHYDPRILGYESTMNLTLADIESSAQSLNGLLAPAQEQN